MIMIISVRIEQDGEVKKVVVEAEEQVMKLSLGVAAAVAREMLRKLKKDKG
jgi:hypothetical protein